MKIIAELLVLLRCIWSHPANRNQRLAAVGRFVAWQCSKRVLRWPVILPLSTRSFIAYPDSPYSSLVVYNQLPDWDELGLLRRILRADDHFLDIGANVGFYSVFASSLIGPTGSIVSIEPNPANVRVLEQQKALNGLGYWSIFPYAIGARSEMVNFSAQTRDTGSIGEASKSPSKSVATQQSIRCSTLDILLGEAEHRRHFIAKIDVEGYETEVLRGARTAIAKKNIWLWIFENNSVALRAHGSTSRQLLELFRSAGYEIYQYSEDRVELSLFEDLDVDGLCNLIACADVQKLQTRIEQYTGATSTNV